MITRLRRLAKQTVLTVNYSVPEGTISLVNCNSTENRCAVMSPHTVHAKFNSLMTQFPLQYRWFHHRPTVPLSSVLLSAPPHTQAQVQAHTHTHTPPHLPLESPKYLAHSLPQPQKHLKRSAALFLDMWEDLIVQTYFKQRGKTFNLISLYFYDLPVHLFFWNTLISVWKQIANGASAIWHTCMQT